MPTHLLGAETYHIPRSSSSGEKEIEDHPTNKACNSSVTLVYEAKVAELFRNVTVTWNKSLINYSLTIGVENLFNAENNYTCKIDLKTWQFWGKKGLKTFQVDGRRVEVYWDFRHAKFSSNPVPFSDYYVALVCDDEVVLTLGDLKKDAYRRTKKTPSFEEPILLCKKEHVYGKKIFCSKAILHDNDKKEHDIAIEMSTGLGDPELWISIDSFEVIHVMNLHWRFRGNEKVTLNNVVLEIFWDVHDWLFNSSTTATSGHGLFIFKPEVLDDSSSDLKQDGDGRFNSNNNIGLRYDSPSDSSAPGFLHVIYAWKWE